MPEEVIALKAIASDAEGHIGKSDHRHDKMCSSLRTMHLSIHEAYTSCLGACWNDDKEARQI